MSKKGIWIVVKSIFSLSRFPTKHNPHQPYHNTKATKTDQKARALTPTIRVFLSFFRSFTFGGRPVSREIGKGCGSSCHLLLEHPSVFCVCVCCVLLPIVFLLSILFIMFPFSLFLLSSFLVLCARVRSLIEGPPPCVL